MAAAESSKALSLGDIFEQGFVLHCEIEDDDGSSTSEIFQKKVSTAVDHFVRATEIVNGLALFSGNEDLSEVPTSELRYLLLPAFLGDLFLRKIETDRMTLLNIAKVYFIDFLKRCKNYGVKDMDLSRYFEETDEPRVEEKSINQMANSRQEKIARYKEQKEQEKRIKELQNILGESSRPVTDEDTQRSYYVLLLKFWINKVVDHLASLQSEVEILNHMQTLKGREDDRPVTTKPQQSFKPILITREMIRNKVFGAGYPSVPTMSQEEFLEKEILEGKVVLDYKEDQMKNKGKTSDDESESEDDPVKLQKKRDWDEWKDDHRRGWGNRENMG